MGKGGIEYRMGGMVSRIINQLRENDLLAPYLRDFGIDLQRIRVSGSREFNALICLGLGRQELVE